MKANSYIKFINILDLIQLYFGSIDLPKMGVRGSIFTDTYHQQIVTDLQPAEPTGTLSDRPNTSNRQLQQHRFERRHRSIDWRWQSKLMQWL
jgi:hypothetical protein